MSLFLICKSLVSIKNNLKLNLFSFSVKLIQNVPFYARIRGCKIENKNRSHLSTNSAFVLLRMALARSIRQQSRKEGQGKEAIMDKVILNSQIELSWGRKFSFPCEASWFLWALQKERENVCRQLSLELFVHLFKTHKNLKSFMHSFVNAI